MSFTAALCAHRLARAGTDAPGEPRLFVRLAIGPAFDRETWTPSGPGPGASYTGWAPALNVAVGWRVRPRLVVAGDLLLSSIVNRTESYRGGSYALADTLHLLDTVSVFADYSLWRYPRLHVGGGPGLLVVTEVDTHMGSTATNVGFALSAYIGYRRHLARAWSIGVIGRLTAYAFGSDAPAPPASSIGLLPVLLLTFSR
ncbi:MAG TPA: hypothetical protein VLT58_08385 [Polyangia bacterium]|nr:hypothetical protein [Polyangia bacterium]